MPAGTETDTQVQDDVEQARSSNLSADTERRFDVVCELDASLLAPMLRG